MLIFYLVTSIDIVQQIFVENPKAPITTVDIFYEDSRPRYGTDQTIAHPRLPNGCPVGYPPIEVMPNGIVLLGKLNMSAVHTIFKLRGDFPDIGYEVWKWSRVWDSGFRTPPHVSHLYKVMDVRIHALRLKYRDCPEPIILNNDLDGLRVGLVNEHVSQEGVELIARN